MSTGERAPNDSLSSRPTVAVSPADLPSRPPLSGGSRDFADRTPADAMAAAVALNELGAHADRYRPERIAGEGGMGRVLRAFDARLNRRVAIKLLHSRDNEAQFSRAIEEARLMAALNHPGLCRVIDVVTDAPRPFIVMEWIEGVDLRAASACMPLQDRVLLFCRVVDAVAAAHDAGFVHRDLKPENIIVRADGCPVVLDFGLASSGSQGPDGPRWGGTVGYSAPEQFDTDTRTPLAPAADVYALGVILYEMLTGRLPFDASDLQKWHRSAMEEDPPLPEVFTPECPTDLERICLCALEREPARRYRSARELAADLRRYTKGEAVAARPSQMAREFASEIESHVAAARRWARLGLVNAAESEALTALLRKLQRPESPWIIDSRKLTHSQVSLYLGGWVVLIGMSVGLWRSWNDLGEITRAAAPAALAATLLAVGAWMQRTSHQRPALAFLVTGSFAFPIAVALLLRQTGWFTHGGAGTGIHELFASVRLEHDGVAVASPPPGGLYNTQILIVAACWLLLACALRWFTEAGAFTVFAAPAALATWHALWLATGNFAHPADERTSASAAAFVIPVGLAMTGLGALLSNAEGRLTSTLGHHRVRRADSWPLLIVGSYSVALCQAIVAYYKPTWFALPMLVPGDEQLARRAVAFMLAGVSLLGVAWALSRSSSAPRRAVSRWLRWLLPSHFLAPLLVLHENDIWHASRLWLVLAAGASFTLCFVSVWKQWKPFFFNGLAYLAYSYFIAFDDPAVRASPALRQTLAFGAFIAGLGLMLLAWWLPGRIAGARLDRAARRVGDRVGSSMRADQ